MAFPFKTGGDFYNCEALNMRLHNHSADLNEYGTGTIYFNTGSNTNHSKHAVVHDGTNFKALAFVDEIATNAEFVKLKEKVDLLIGDDVDTDTIIDSWKEVQAFLADIEDTKTLQGMLSSYLPKSGGTITTNSDGTTLVLNTPNSTWTGIRFKPSNSSTGATLAYSAEGFGVSDEGWKHFYTLLHSGNITEVLDDLNNATGARFFAGTFQASNRPNTGVNFAAGLTINDIATGILHQISFDNTGNLFARSQKSDGWRDWKTIAFTDSNVASADYATSAGVLSIGQLTNIGALDHTLWYDWGNQLGDSFGNYIYGILLKSTDSNIYTRIAGGSYDAYLRVRHYNYGDDSGWKTIAFTDSNVASANAIQVNYSRSNTDFDILFTNPRAEWSTGIDTVYISDKSDRRLTYNPSTGTLKLNGNVLIGTPNEIKSGAKLQIKGDVYVDGNIIATKEVSAGGAGEEGESGDGGAEVISQQLASGQSTYTITNTIKRSDIAVSLYEWNANNGSWDMCLADISVKDATITVTFGSATSVNHKLVAVG